MFEAILWIGGILVVLVFFTWLEHTKNPKFFGLRKVFCLPEHHKDDIHIGR